MTTKEAKPEDRIDRWHKNWKDGQIGFHQAEVHPMLERHLEKLAPDRKPHKIFLPLCGKSVDMKWLADKGFTVVGVDGVQMALEQFFTEQDVESVKDAVSPNLIKSRDDKIRLYCRDIFEFTPDIEGTFDSIWDRASLVALDRDVLTKYIEIVKKLLRPSGRILLETLEYDLTIMDDLPEGTPRPPPPHPMYGDEVKRLYGPDWTVEEVDRAGRTLRGKDIELVIYLIQKS